MMKYVARKWSQGGEEEGCWGVVARRRRRRRRVLGSSHKEDKKKGAGDVVGRPRRIPSGLFAGR